MGVETTLTFFGTNLSVVIGHYASYCIVEVCSGIYSMKVCYCCSWYYYWASRVKLLFFIFSLMILYSTISSRMAEMASSTTVIRCACDRNSDSFFEFLSFIL